MRRALFGAEGYGLDPLGTEASVASLSAKDAADFYHRMANPENCVLAILATFLPATSKKPSNNLSPAGRKPRRLLGQLRPRPR